MLKTRWLAMLFVIIIFTCIGGQAFAVVYPETQEEVFFADSNLADAVRLEMGLGAGAPILADDLANLEKLYAHGKGIISLEGLERATGLKILKLHENEITDIAPLASLTNLHTLYLRHNKITDLSPLSSLTNLRTVYLRKNQISDISPLAGLTALSTLDIAENSGLTDISPLAGLSLQHLDISSTNITDFTTVSGMTSLSKLFLNGLNLSSLDCISTLTGLKELEVLNNQLTDLTSLKDLTKMERLYAGYNTIIDISPLTGMDNLHTLKLWHNRIEDASPLLELASLKKLYIKENAFSLTAGSPASAVFSTLTARGVNIDVAPSQPSKCVSGVSLEPASVTLTAGEYKKLTATVSPADAANKTVTWSSDDPKVATVQNGKVTAVAPGTAVIKVKTKDGGKIATCKVTVIAREEPDPTIPVTGITLSHSSMELAPEEKILLEATVVPADATDKTITWTSDNPAAVQVDQNGKVKAMAPGSAAVTVTSKDGSHTATCLVTVSAPALTDLAFKYTNITLKTGSEKKLPLVISPQGAWAEYSWQSSGPEVASVDQAGNVSALAPGETTITVSAGSLSAACVLTVVDPDTAGIEYDLEQQKNTLSIPKELLQYKDQLGISHGNMKIVIPTQAWLSALTQLGLDSSESIMVEVEEYKPTVSGKLLAIGPAYSFKLQADEVRVSSFAEKLLLTFNYDPKQVTDPEKLAIYWYNSDSDNWDKLPSMVSTEDNSVSALISHWSSFALLQPKAATPPAWWYYAIFSGLAINAVLVVIWLVKRR